MTIALALHLLVVGVLAALAALLGERAARRLRLPARYIWVASVLVTLGVPVFALLSREPGASREVPLAATAPALMMPADIMVHATQASSQVADLVLPEWVARVDVLALALWAALTLAAIVRLASAHWRLRRQSRLWSDAEVAGYRARLSSGTGPAVVGVFRPAIVVPEWALESPPPVVRLMLEHEQEHVRARDPLVLLLADIAVALAPWHPALHWQRARLRLAVELDCDARVLRTHRDTRRYAELLLRVARRPAFAAEHLPAAVALAPRPSTLERRITAMTENRSRNPVAAAALSAAAAAVLMAACEAPRTTAPTPEREVPVADIVADMQRTEGDSGSRVLRLRGVATGDTVLELRGDSTRMGTVLELRRSEIRDSLEVRRARGEYRFTEPAVALHTVDGVLVRRLEDLNGLGLDPDMIESVEILKGDAAVRMYGREASAGVVSIVMRDSAKFSESTPREIRVRPATSGGQRPMEIRGLPRDSRDSSRMLLRSDSRERPLVIVDGVVLTDPDGISTLDPQRIQSMEVIKGESALAKYGSRGANGVIVVTMKP